VFAEHDAIKCEVGVWRRLRLLRRRRGEGGRREREKGDFGVGEGGGRDYDDEDDARSIAMFVPHELERVEEEGEE
jgi:hypothetical protein